MAREIAGVPEVIGRQQDLVRQPLGELVARLRGLAPRLVVTCARGSSAHAATFGKHLIERHLGIPVCAAAPSIASVYGRELDLRGQLVLAISQSGTSDDLVAFAASARDGGALTVAVTNSEGSPLAAACELTVPIGAGPEISVAATKTFIATACVLLRMTAAWAGDARLEAAVSRLPQRLQEATALDWSAAVDAFAEVESLTTIGRGPTLAIAREAALKLKETCNLHAEAFSGAEFLHGPVALVSAQYPVLLFMPSDAASAGMRDLAVELTLKQALALVAEAGPDAPRRLPALAADQPETDAVCLIQSFYGMLVELATRRGCDVDSPRHLQKVTRTL